MTTEKNGNRFIVMTSSACMPGSCWGQYRNVAIVELEPGYEGKPKMISTHARGCLRVVHHYGPQNVGTTKRCAYQKMLRHAEEAALALNNA